mgnify:CR=1 FL=1
MCTPSRSPLFQARIGSLRGRSITVRTNSHGCSTTPPLPRYL